MFPLVTLPDSAASLASSAFWHRVVDALPMTIWTLDLDGRITSTNRQWSCFAADNGALDIAAGSLIGRSVFESVDDEASRNQLERAMALLRERRVPFVRWEFPCNSPTEERVFVMHVTPLLEDEVVSGFVFGTVDITPSHRSRDALLHTGIALAEAIAVDRVFEQVAVQLGRGIASTGCVVALAHGDAALLRIVHRQGIDPIISNASLEERLQGSWLSALAKGHVVLDHSKSGLELSAPLASREGVLGAITAWADAIDSEQALEEAERFLLVVAAQATVALERAWLVERVGEKRRLEAVGEVAVGVAHELRNPLFGISASAQLLQLAARDQTVVDRNVGRILREVERLNRMVTSLLEFGRPYTTHPVAADPELVWDDILEGERSRLDGKRLTLHRTRPQPPVLCMIDVEQYGQVCRNVLVNACDASLDGGEITLASARAPSGGMRTRLTNGGPAIPPDILPRVFEFFFSTKAGGSGIGLALCQRIMDEHQGTIAIDSTPDAGTTVTLVVPTAPESMVTA